MSRELFLEVLDRGIEDARVAFDASGQRYVVGRGPAAGGEDGCAVRVKVHDPRFFRRVLAQGNLGLGESYMSGGFTIEEGSLEELLEILLRNKLDRKLKQRPLLVLRLLLLRLADNLRGKAHNVQRHYDVGDDLFQAFLDSSLTYSCGYAEDPGDDLETLQKNKLDRICRKLRLEEGDRLLDVGCGFGGLLIHAAKHYGARATGVTISKRHAAHGRERAAEEGVADRVRIEYADFNEISGTYDKVVSVGMMEHVPRREYGRYFSRIAEVLAPRGLGLVHTIGANAPKNEHDPFIQKYIFPNSNQPQLSEITRGLESHGLAILDVENMIRHYGYTARRWLENFRRNRDGLDPDRYDDVFKRMWEYYLCCAVAGGFASDAALYQVLFTNDHTAPMPLHRV
ncbi:MAG: methyltransferase domain-containing protein [Acidobacteria bacterium]|nr:MAG: methyltransferase domain-containing protein [Acidobacteriota bacterium]